MNDIVKGPYAPQQVIAPGQPGVRPPKGWVPPLGGVLNLMGVYDLDSGFWVGLPIQALTEQLVLAEKQHALDRIDPRNGLVKVTVPIGTAVGTSKSGEIEVPEGEVWYLCEHEIFIPQAAGLTAGDISVNFRVSSFPKVNGADKLYYSTDDPQVYLTSNGEKIAGLTATQAQIAAGDIADHKLITSHGWVFDGTNAVARDWVEEVKRDFRQGDELNTELRLVGGDKLTLVATVATNAIAGAAVDVYLRVWGRRGKRLVA